MSGGADAPGLISAQAHALLLADQPEQTRELLQQLAKKHPLSATDHLHLGLAMLASKGRGPEALEHVRAAEAELAPHPRVLAAMALALHRNDEVVPALAALQRAQEALGSEPDPFDEALVQRGTKLLRTVQKAQQKRERKPGQAQIPTEVAPRVATGVAVTAPNPDDRAKSPRKAKKEERRSARRAAKAEKRVQGVEPVKVKKAGKSATKGVVEANPAKGGIRKAEAKPVAEMQAAKPVAEVKPVAEMQAEAKPVAEMQAEAKPGAEMKPAAEMQVERKPVAEMQAEARPVAEMKPVAETRSEAKPVAETEATVTGTKSEMEAEPVAAMNFEVKAKSAVEVNSLAQAEPVAETNIEANPVLETRPAAEARPATPAPVSQDRPTVASSEPRSIEPARPDGMRVPAPPAGAALFGSLQGAPRSSGPAAAPVLGLPRAPGAMPTMSGPSVAGVPALRPPVVPSSSAAPWAGTPPTLPRNLPPIAGGPVLSPRPEDVPVPRAPAAIVPTGPSPVAPPIAPTLAQALPDADDGWDDMLDALEADAPVTPS
jgi:hypothetical protein